MHTEGTYSRRDLHTEDMRTEGPYTLKDIHTEGHIYEETYTRSDICTTQRDTSKNLHMKTWASSETSIFDWCQTNAICKVDCYISFNITGDMEDLLGGKSLDINLSCVWSSKVYAFQQCF